MGFITAPTREALDSLRTRKWRRGAGAHTLCESCNSKTSGWYGGAYVDLACQAASLLTRAIVGA